MIVSISVLQFADVEEEFLHAAEFGDVPTVRRLLNDYPELNVDCIDALGRTALRLAVKNEHLEVRTIWTIHSILIIIMFILASFLNKSSFPNN